jgi:hypothetical protein
MQGLSINPGLSAGIAVLIELGGAKSIALFAGRLSGASRLHIFRPTLESLMAVVFLVIHQCFPQQGIGGEMRRLGFFPKGARVMVYMVFDLDALRVC